MIKSHSYLRNKTLNEIKKSQFEATQKVYNVGCEENISVLDLAKKIKKSTNSDVDFSFNNSRPGDVKDSLADTNLAKKHLNISEVISLDEGLKRTNIWYKNQLVKQN